MNVVQLPLIKDYDIHRPLRRGRYQVQVIFCGGRSPYTLADFDIRQTARDYCVWWALESLFRRCVPEAAIAVAVVRSRDGMQLSCTPLTTDSLL